MKLFTQKIIALVLLLCCIAQTPCVFAQDEIDTTFNTRMNYVFGVLEKNRVPNGMLLDYAMEFTDIKAFNGSVLEDSNYTDYATLGDIYNTLITSRIHTNATGLINPNVWDSLWYTQRQDGRITLSGVFFNYSRFKDNAIGGGFMTISSERFIDRYVSGVWQNPYIADKVFAITPSTDYYEGKNLQVVLPSNLWLTNGGSTVSSISIDVSDGLGYHAVTLGQSLPISYSDTGRKEWKFKLTLTTGATSYTWFWPTGWTNSSGQGTQYLTVRTNTTSGIVGVKVANACNAGGSPATQFVNVNTFCGSAFIVTPNPASDNVTVSSTQAETTTLTAGVSSTATNNRVTGFTKIKLYDKIGNLKKEYNFAKGTTQTKLDLYALVPDMYIIKVFDGTNWEEHKIIVSP